MRNRERLAICQHMVSRLVPCSLIRSSIRITNRFIRYSFQPDSAAANLISPKKEIFDFPDEDIQIIKHTLAWLEESTSTTSEETARSFASKFGLGAEQTLASFAVAASASTNLTRTSTWKKFRFDAINKARRYSIRYLTPFPWKHLNQDAKTFFMSSTPAEISKTYGAFYPHSLDLGGAVRTTIVKDVSRSYSLAEFESEQKASYQDVAMATSAQISNSISGKNKHTRISERLYSKFIIEGGDSNVWLQPRHQSVDNFNALLANWSDTIEDDNLVPIGIKLRPLWELVKKLDPARGDALEIYQRKLWTEQLAQHLKDDGKRYLEDNHSYPYLTELSVVEGGRPCPSGYSVIGGREGPNGDLNQGCWRWIGDVKHIYLCGKWSRSGRGITNVAMTAGDEDSVQNCDFGEKNWYPAGFGEYLNGDLNHNAKGKYVYLCLERDMDKLPITDIAPVRRNYCPMHFTWVEKRMHSNGDANQEANCEFIRICVSKAHFDRMDG